MSIHRLTVQVGFTDGTEGIVWKAPISISQEGTASEAKAARTARLKACGHPFDAWGDGIDFDTPDPGYRTRLLWEDYA